MRVGTGLTGDATSEKRVEGSIACTRSERRRGPRCYLSRRRWDDLEGRKTRAVRSNESGFSEDR